MMEENASLKPFTTFGIEARARYFARFGSTGDLQSLLDDPRAKPRPRLILGGGSNLLLTGDIDGVVLRNEIMGIEAREEGEHVFIRVGAGENWHRLVLYCVKHGFAGMENLALIPGSAGASPMQNIGAYGVEIKDIFHELEAVQIADGSLHRFSRSDCAFGYRESVFKGKYRDQFVITQVTYRLSRTPHFNTSYGAIGSELERMGVQDLSIAAIAQAVINIRSSKLPDPAQIGNAGSFFKNPTVSEAEFQKIKEKTPGVVAFPTEGERMKLAAGWLIEQCGWKGYREGDAGCYPRQALVLVNYGNATGQEIYHLSQRIIESVHERFDVLLEREVNIL